MAAAFVFRKRAFLNPRSTNETSYVQAIVESSQSPRRLAAELPKTVEGYLMHKSRT